MRLLGKKKFQTNLTTSLKCAETSIYKGVQASEVWAETSLKSHSKVTQK